MNFFKLKCLADLYSQSIADSLLYLLQYSLLVLLKDEIQLYIKS